jgi:hypothetical protein
MGGRDRRYAHAVGEDPLDEREDVEVAPQINASGFEGAYHPYAQKRDALLDALKKFAHEEFQ